MVTKDLNRKKRLLIFHPALAPYRIDQFNLLSEMYDLKVVFLMENLMNFNMNQSKLRDACHFEFSFLLKGLLIKRRLFRFGMLREIRRYNPDIVMGFEFSLTTQYLLLLKRTGIIRQKIGSFIDDSPDMCKNVQTKLREFIRNRTVNQLDFIVVMSKEVAHFYKNYFNLNDNNVLVSPILQLPERLRKDSEMIESFANLYVRQYQLKGKKAVLFVGRLVSEKALPQFIEIITPILISDDDVRIILVGEGVEEEPLKAFVEKNKLDKKVVFAGKYQAEELYGWYACASGFVLPSVFEPYGAVVNEALIFGLKVFCSKYAGASSLIKSENGQLFNPLDRVDTYESFQRFLKDIKPIGEISLVNTPPLIDNYRPLYLQKWGKLIKKESTIMSEYNNKLFNI